jgi:DNA polymerase III epsilon subunit-like protein
MQGLKMKYLVLSCETSGLNLEDSRNPVKGSGDLSYAVISAGLIIIDEKFNKIDEMYVEIDYTDIPNVCWSKEAMAVNGFTLEHLKENGIPFYEAIEDMGSFILEHFDTRAITVIGHNTSSFTLPFFEAMFKRVDIDLNFSSHVYDLSTLGFTILGVNKKREIYEMLGIKQGTRNALIDARNILKSFSTINKMWTSLL